MLFSLEKKNVLLTGGAGGIGKALVSSLVEAGANLVITGRNASALESMCSEFGDKVRYITLDLSEDFNSDQILESAQNMLGAPLDCLICNAGLTNDKLVMRMSDEDWGKVIKVNLSANFSLNRAAVKSMLKNRVSGRIINITSVIAFRGNAGQANYAASKAGLTAMSKSIAHEVAGRGITVNCIAPGFIETPMTDAMSEKAKEAIKSQIPMSKFGSPSDVAAAALFLCSNESGYITGQTIHVNGGMLML